MATPVEEPRDELLSTRQAAELCRVTEERMRTLALDGRVPATSAHHLWFFSRVELERLLREDPRVLYAHKPRRVLEVTEALREKRRATMLRLNAMRTKQERRENAQRGYAGLLAKFRREIDPDGTLDPAERERRVWMRYRAHMAEARSQRAAARRLTTTKERLAALEAQATERRARRQVGTDHANAAPESLESLAICFDCWRNAYGGRVPAGLSNKLCEEHQRELEQFAAELRQA